MPRAYSLPDFTGFVISGRYKLTRLVGSGSFGVVYQAIDHLAPAGSDTPYRAVKLVSKAGRRIYEVGALRREAILHKRASEHPNVVTLHEATETKDYFMFVMDFCCCGDLGDRISSLGPYTDDRELRNTFLAIVDAVDALHQKGIYHRDLKPANILLSENSSELYITDFGMATITEYGTRRCGTRAYMPPEYFDPKAHHGLHSAVQSDTWALGIILLSMLCGHYPWPQASAEHANYAEFVRNPAFLLEALPISVGLNKILRRMLRANPAIRMRLADVRRAISELDTFLRDVNEPLDSMGDAAGAITGSTLASEIDILCVRPALPEDGGRARDSSAGPGLDFTPSASAKKPSPSACPKGGMVAAPEDSAASGTSYEMKHIRERLRQMALRMRVRIKFGNQR